MVTSRFVFFACMLIGFHLPAKEMVISGAPLGCKDSEAGLKKLTIESKVLLNKRLLNATLADTNSRRLTKELIFKQAAELQVKHLLGLFRTTKSDGANTALSSFRSEIKIKSVDENTSYFGQIRFKDFTAIDQRHLLSQSPYFNAALKSDSDQIQKNEGILVTYQTQVIVADCSQMKIRKFQDFLVPLDPYFSFFIDKPIHRKSRNLGPRYRGILSSCQADELLVFGDTDQNWYFWSPTEKKKLSDGTTDSCKPVKERVGFLKVLEVEAIPNSKPIDQEFFASPVIPATLKVSIVFGRNSESDYFRNADMQVLRKELDGILKRCAKSDLVSSCIESFSGLLNPDETKKVFEPGLWYFLTYLRDVNRIVDLEKFSIESKVTGHQFQALLIGKMRQSQKNIELSVFFGRTTLDYGDAPSLEYLRFLHQSFSKSHVFSYLGHSGLGANLDFGLIGKKWSEASMKPIEREAPLWMGAFNCEGFSYFGSDLDLIFKKGKVKAYLTLSSGVEVDSILPLAQLSAIDKLFEIDHKVFNFQSYMGSFIKTKDFYVEIALQ